MGKGAAIGEGDELGESVGADGPPEERGVACLGVVVRGTEGGSEDMGTGM